MKIAVIGAGSWGTALAWLLSHNKHEISLWAYEDAVTETIKKTRENTSYLPGITLNHFIVPTSNIEQALYEAAWVLFVVPSHVSRNVLTTMRPYLSATTPIVSATKGIERKTLMLVSEVICEVLERKNSQQVAVLSGPSFAKELVQSNPTAVSLATKNTRLARRIENALATPFFRMFLSSDLVGVQLGGALKNVIALAAGGADGLGFGYNTKAILLTRGLSEMARLGIAMGADINTFYGQSGMGDLFLTCGGSLSRNRAVGEKIGTGESLESIQKSMNMIAEGVYTTQSALALSQKYQVDMPIVHEIHRVLFEGKAPRQAVMDLMALARGEEIPLEVKRVSVRT
ncbi:Glycerol-3-phosphate dehydrogenase [NAD(P)+] [hydrothermal vent metagenome]|uniref:Glycerol-3-phosphate dehydrogenase [NAD(P)+] n=1 Tax=hydrothermal vent metagenome TaxID=652676 RepID=A0A3B1CU19_9ZZZZ